MPKPKLALLPLRRDPPLIRPPNKPVQTVSKKLRYAMDGFEKGIGGRDRLIYLLTCHSNNNPEILRVRDIITDPQYAHLPLADVCVYSRLDTCRLFEAVRDAALSNTEIISLIDLPKRIPRVTQEIITQALPHPEECPVCYGGKQIRVKVKVKKGEAPPPPVDPVTCPRCLGKGTITVKGSIEHQRLALEIAHMIKTGGLAKFSVNQNVMVNASQPTLQGGSLEQLQQAVGELLSGKPAVDVVDADSVTVVDPVPIAAPVPIETPPGVAFDF